MKGFRITFIPSHALEADDPSDYKEWKPVQAESEQAAKDTMGSCMVLSCEEMSEADCKEYFYE
jgi:hypothetical protein